MPVPPSRCVGALIVDDRQRIFVQRRAPSCRLTATEIQQLRESPEREAIEAETNRLAAPPYGVLSPVQRVSLLADLAVLPGRRGD